MNKGFTIIEIVIAVALIAVLSAAYFFVANPSGQVASSRNTERASHLQSIMLAIRENIADQTSEQFSCSAGPLPTSSARMTSRGGAGNYNIAPCIILSNGAYGLFTMPFDPNATSSYFNSVTDYDTDYTIVQNASGSITLGAPSAELGKTISVTR